MKTITRRLLFLMLVLFGVIACDKPEVHTPLVEQSDTISAQPDQVSITIAKKWFYEEYLKDQGRKATNESKRLIRNIYWERAKLDKMTDGKDLLIIPIEHHNPGEPANSDTYLWIFRYKDNKLNAKVIEYLSSAKDLKTPIDISNFTGAMSVRDWNGKLLNGFTFKNNKPVGLLHSVKGVETERVKEAKSGRADVTICNTVVFRASTCTSYFYKICENGNCTELRPNDTPTFCEFYEIIVPQCYWVADFPGQPNPYSGGPSDLTIIAANQMTMPGMSIRRSISVNILTASGSILDYPHTKLQFMLLNQCQEQGKLLREQMWVILLSVLKKRQMAWSSGRSSAFTLTQWILAGLAHTLRIMVATVIRFPHLSRSPPQGLRAP
jgi:hypothetical protein